MSDTNDGENREKDLQHDDGMPTTDELQEPSIAKDPDEEPKAPKAHDPEPDHEAVGIGVIDSPNADAEGSA